MVSFIVPLKSKQMSKDWQYTQLIFERTLKSICNQTTDNYEVVVVCHEIPDIEYKHSKILYEQVDYNFEPVDENGNSLSDFAIKFRDKGRKTYRGTQIAREYSCQHLMIVDADDLISNRIAAYCNNHISSPGWYVNRGYQYYEKSEYIYLKYRNFDIECGTSSIIRSDLVDVPINPEFDNLNYDYFKFFQNHQYIRGKIKAKDNRYIAFPFPAAIYCITGDNSYVVGRHGTKLKKMLKNILCRKKHTRRIKEEFGLYQIKSKEL